MKKNHICWRFTKKKLSRQIQNVNTFTYAGSNMTVWHVCAVHVSFFLSALSIFIAHTMWYH